MDVNSVLESAVLFIYLVILLLFCKFCLHLDVSDKAMVIKNITKNVVCHLEKRKWNILTLFHRGFLCK